MKRIAVVLILLAATLAGCGPKLQAVRDFSAISMAATEQAKTAVGYLPQSCIETQQALSGISTEGLSENETEKQAVIAIREKRNRQMAETACRNQITAAAGVGSALDILEEYFKAMSALSSNELGNDGSRLDELRTRLAQAQLNNKELFTDTTQLDAVFSVADYLIALGRTAYQKRKVSEYLKESYAAADKALGQISALIGTNCVVELQNQLSALRKEIYVHKLRDARDSTGKINKATQFLLYQNFESKSAPIREAITMCQGTAQALTKARAVLKDLHSHSDDLDSEYINDRVMAFYNDVVPDLKTLGVIH